MSANEELHETAEMQDTPEDRPQKFIRNDRYFTICVYTFFLVAASTVVIKAIVSFGATKAFFRSIFQAAGPFLIALVIAYVLLPAVRAVNRWILYLTHGKHEKRVLILSMIIVYVTAIGFLIGLLVYILPQVVGNIADLIGLIPQGYEQLRELTVTLQEHFPSLNLAPITSMLDSTQNDLVASLTDWSKDMIPALYTASVSVVQWFVNFIIAFVVSVYMVYGKDQLKRFCRIILYAFAPADKVDDIREALIGCNHIFSKYLVSKMIDSLIIGILCAILMTILKLPYVFLISLVVGITNMIPYFGPFIGAIPGLVIELVASPIKALIFLIMILALQQFDGLFLGPKLMGSSIGMKPIWVIFAITFGGKFFGVIGMFLGVPVLAMMAYLGERLVDRRLRKRNMSLKEIP